MITIGMNPVAFSIGPFSVRWYGIMVVLAIVVIVVWALRGAKRAGFSEELILTAALWGIPAGIVFSRLLQVVDNLDYYIVHPGQIVGLEGLTIFGAILGATLAIWAYSKVKKGFSFGVFADLIAPGVVLAQAVGRIGCTINGCCYGMATTLPWGFVYTHPDSYAPLGVAVHPTMVYELLWDLFVFAVLLRLRGRLRPDGSLFLVYLATYSVGKFAIHFLREGTAFIGPLQEAQFLSLLVLAVTVPLLACRTRWARTEVVATEGVTLPSRESDLKDVVR